MGIAPITNLIPLAIDRAPASTLEPLPMARVENAARSGDETYSPSHGRSEEEDGDDASNSAELEFSMDSRSGEEESKAGAEEQDGAFSGVSESQISLFA